MLRCFFIALMFFSLTACSQAQWHQFGGSASQGGQQFGTSMSQSISSSLQQMGQQSLS